MMQASPPRTFWRPRGVRRVHPRAVRAAIALALLLLGLPLLVELGGAVLPALPPWLARTQAWALFSYAGGALCGLVAVGLARGFSRPADVALDARSLYLVAGERERRIPRSYIDEAIVRPRRTAKVELRLTTGAVLRIEMRDAAAARALVAALSADV
jgi:hypothetical protein